MVEQMVGVSVCFLSFKTKSWHFKKRERENELCPNNPGLQQMLSSVTSGN